jgi:choline dehydrogenase-like flavoprotein
MGMVIYPSRSGLNAWEGLGNPGWGWEGLSHYIRKFHTAAPPSEEGRETLSHILYEQKHVGDKGPVNVSFGDHYMPYYGAWMESFKTLGYPQTEDPINGAGTGPFISPSAVNQATHTRSHSAAAYLGEEVRSRPNLRVVTGAQVEKIVLEKRGDEAIATGVSFSKGEEVFVLSVKKEVILAAGATQTPKILELSGIGDEKVLQSHGVPTIINNPSVGENLQEHGLIPYSYEVADGLPSGDMARDPEFATAAMAAYQKNGSGPLGYIPFASAFMPCVGLSHEDRNQMVETIKVTISNPNTSKTIRKQLEAQVKLLEVPEETTGQYILVPFQMHSREKTPHQAFSPSHPGLFVTIAIVLSHPFSRGSAHISSAYYRDASTIDIGMFTNPVDLELHARQCLLANKLMETEPLASLMKKDGARLHAAGPLDLDQAKDLCKDLVMSNYHFSGTCVMMPQEDGGVVDHRLKVYGTSNVRVVDASIFPLEPRGNIQATVFAVAEKAADIIKEDMK